MRREVSGGFEACPGNRRYAVEHGRGNMAVSRPRIGSRIRLLCLRGRNVFFTPHFRLRRKCGVKNRKSTALPKAKRMWVSSERVPLVSERISALGSAFFSLHDIHLVYHSLCGGHSVFCIATTDHQSVSSRISSWVLCVALTARYGG